MLALTLRVWSSTLPPLLLGTRSPPATTTTRPPTHPKPPPTSSPPPPATRNAPIHTRPTNPAALSRRARSPTRDWPTTAAGGPTAVSDDAGMMVRTVSAKVLPVALPVPPSFPEPVTAVASFAPGVSLGQAAAGAEPPIPPIQNSSPASRGAGTASAPNHPNPTPPGGRKPGSSHHPRPEPARDGGARRRGGG